MEKDANLSNQLKGLYISTYGCQMNVNDSDRMYSLLEMSNYSPVQSPDLADLIIINSCSVREKPVHKVRSEVGRYKDFKQKNPRLKIGVAGCVAQQERSKLLSDLPLLDFVFGPDNIDELPSIVSRLEEGQKRVSAARLLNKQSYHVETLVQNPGVATFVNITKGCDNFCTFCIVPFTRGRLRSRPLNHIVDDVHRLVKRGVKEITVLGQNVNSYLSDCGADFGKLLREIAEKTDIQRIRYTTSHPKDFNEDLVRILADYREKICEYIHLPVQSGNSRILEMMNRGYTREDYLNKVEMIKKHIPDVVLSTDIIVGFPSETREEYEDTLSLIEEVEYESLFAFKYSPRPFTKALKYEDQIPESEKSDRLNLLFERHKVQSFELAKKYEGQVLDVLVETVDKKREGVVTGRSTQNKVVHLLGNEDLVGKTVPVKILRAFPQTLRGEIVN